MASTSPMPPPPLRAKAFSVDVTGAVSSVGGGNRKKAFTVDNDDIAAFLAKDSSSSPTRPKGGHNKHRKTHSLVGFDPLLAASSSADSPKQQSHQQAIHPFSSLANELSKSPPRPSAETKASHPLLAPQRGSGGGSLTPTDVQKHPLVGEIDFSKLDLFDNNSEIPKTPNPKKKGHRKTKSLAAVIGLSGWVGGGGGGDKKDRDGEKQQQLTPKRSQHRRRLSVGGLMKPAIANTSTPTTPLQQQKQTLNPGNNNTPLSKKQAESQRKLASKMWRQENVEQKKISSPPISPSGDNHHPSSDAAPMSPMIRDLMELNKEAEQQQKGNPSLFLPSLASAVQPQATSFLTGRESAPRSSEQDATAWQVDIPTLPEFKSCTKLCQFLDLYRKEFGPTDLRSLIGYTAQNDLKPYVENKRQPSELDAFYRPTVEWLLECAGPTFVSVKAYFQSASVSGDDNPDTRREALIIEQERAFLVVIRGTLAEQQQQQQQPSKAETIKLQDGDAGATTAVTVLTDVYTALAELQTVIFTSLDKLTQQNPFYDVVFTGYNFGASMATLASYAYANTRSTIRVAAMTTNSTVPVGCEDFKLAVHSLTNLKVMRLESSSSSPTSTTNSSSSSSSNHRQHVGHLLRISSNQKQIKAYRFGVDVVETASVAIMGTSVRSMLSKPKEKKEKITDYVNALEGFTPDTWVQNYQQEEGKGVLGKDNEARQVA